MKARQDQYFDFWRKQAGKNFFNKIVDTLFQQSATSRTNFDHSMIQSSLHECAVNSAMDLGTRTRSSYSRGSCRVDIEVVNKVHCTTTFALQVGANMYIYSFTFMNVFPEPIYDVVNDQVRFLV